MTPLTRLATVVMAAGLLLPRPAYPQDVTIEQLVAMAMKQAPALQVARAENGVAAGRVGQAGLKANPMLATTHEHEPGGMAVTAGGIEWPLELFRRQARVAAAERTAESVSLAVRDRERLLAAVVRQEAGRLLAARRTFEVTNEALTAARRMRDLLDRRVTEGGTPKIDANLAAVEAMRIEAEVALAAGEVEAATIELKALVGLPASAPLVLSDSLERLVASPMVPRFTTVTAMEARPDIREALARISAAGAGAERARQDGRLDLSLIAGYSRNRLTFPQLGLDEHHGLVPIQNSFTTVTIGARATLPFRNRNQGAIAAAQAEREGAEALFSARQLSARAEIDAAVAREREARRAVELYATSIRQLAQQNVDVMLEGYDLGRFLLSDVLSEQRRYLDVEAGYTTVLARAYDARVAVSRAFGEIP